MRMVNVCDHCKEKPIPFAVEGSVEGKEEFACYHVIDVASNDPTVLMSDGSMAFRICPTAAHPIKPSLKFLCGKCFFKLYSNVVRQADSDEDDDEGEDWKNKGECHGS